MSTNNPGRDLLGAGLTGAGGSSTSSLSSASRTASGIGRPLRSESTRPLTALAGARSISRASSGISHPVTPQGNAVGSAAVHASERSGHSSEATPRTASTASTALQAPVYTQSNALFDADTSMTPSVRVREYSPALLQEYSNPPSTEAAAGAAGLQQLSQQLQQQLQLPQNQDKQQQKQQQPAGSLQAPRLNLPTAGDLFTPADQAYMDAGLFRDVCGARAVIPAWSYSRPFLTGAFIMQQDLLAQETATDPPPNLSSLPSSAQEQALVNDLLYTFLGIAGKYIKPQLVSTSSIYPQLGWQVVVPLEPCMLEQVQRLLPVSECVVTIQRFIETRSWMEHPLVVQALAAAMRSLLQQWLVMVAQLEHQMRCGKLSLQALAYHCQQPMASLRLLAGIAAEAASTCMSSATLLNLLSAKAASLAGDRAGQRLVQKLLEAAAEPYFCMLELWLTTGDLDDPYKEFMVEGDRTITKDTLTDDQQLAYWQHRYVLRRDVMREPPEGRSQQRVGGRLVWQAPLDVPEFLAPAADAILATGKHLNAIRACGKPVPPPLTTEAAALRYDPAGSYMAAIQAAKARASAGLMQVMMQEVGLTSWLTSLKRFFLLDQGDLLVHLLAFAHEELCSSASKISRPRLQSLLELAVRSSSCAGDPHMENMGYTFDPRSLAELARAVLQMAPADLIPITYKTQRAEQKKVEAGWQVLMFTFQVEWPVSLVVGRPQLLQYQLLFKHLFALKFLERQLNGVWLQLQQTRRLPRQDQEAFKLWHQLCSRMTFLVTEVLRYVTIDVLEPLWRAMQAALRQATSIDEVMACHQHFLDRAVEGALLNALPVVTKLEEVLLVGRHLCIQAQELLPEVDDNLDGTVGRGTKAAGGRILRTSTFTRTQEALLQAAADPTKQNAIAVLQRDFQRRSRGLLDKMQEVYRTLLAGPGRADSTDSADMVVRRMWGREELEALSDLIERLDVEQQHLSPAARAAMALQRGG